jgi:hypothetical protein
MDWTQWAYIGAIAAALAVGRPGVLIASVMLANLAGTLILSGQPMSVAIFDALSGAALAFGSARSQSVAVFFAAMVVWAVVSWWAGFTNAATYAIVDVLAYGQLVIIGGAGFGMGRRIRLARRAFAGRSPDTLGGVAVENTSIGNSQVYGVSVALVSQAGK